MGQLSYKLAPHKLFSLSRHSHVITIARRRLMQLQARGHEKIALKRKRVRECVIGKVMPLKARHDYERSNVCTWNFLFAALEDQVGESAMQTASNSQWISSCLQIQLTFFSLSSLSFFLHDRAHCTPMACRLFNALNRYAILHELQTSEMCTW